MQTDTIKAIYTYTVAALVVIGGGFLLFISRSDSGIGDLQIVMAGFIGSSLTFLYGQEVQTRTSRQAASATQAAVAATTASTLAAGNGHTAPIDVEAGAP